MPRLTPSKILIGDAQFHEMCMRWMHAALALLQSKPVTMAPEYDVVLVGDGYSTTLGPNRPNLRQTVVTYAGDLTSQAEFLELAQLIFGITAIAAGLFPIVTLSTSVTQDQLAALWRVCKMFLLEYVTRNETFNFEQALFERVYVQLQEYIVQPGPFATEWLLHLSNLSIESERLELENTLTLRQVSVDERIWIIRQQLRTRFVHPFTPDLLTVLECKDMEPKWSSQLQISGNLLNTAHMVVIALRLLKAQPVDLTGYHWQPVNQPFLTFQRHYTPFNLHLPPIAYFGEKYVLTSGDTDELLAVWPQVRDALNDKLLKVAFTRLEDSYHRTKDEDRLIDYWTALESLFMPRGAPPAQQGRMVAEVLAHYIGVTVTERVSIATTLVESHGLRNAIIHADEIKQLDKINEMASKTGTYLRQALRKRIQE